MCTARFLSNPDFCVSLHTLLSRAGAAAAWERMAARLRAAPGVPLSLGGGARISVRPVGAGPEARKRPHESLGCSGATLRDTHAESVAHTVCNMPELLPTLLGIFPGYNYGRRPLGSSFLKQSVRVEKAVYKSRSGGVATLHRVKLQPPASTDGAVLPSGSAAGFGLPAAPRQRPGVRAAGRTASSEHGTVHGPSSDGAHGLRQAPRGPRSWFPLLGLLLCLRVRDAPWASLTAPASPFSSGIPGSRGVGWDICQNAPGTSLWSPPCGDPAKHLSLEEGKPHSGKPQRHF